MGLGDEKSVLLLLAAPLIGVLNPSGSTVPISDDDEAAITEALSMLSFRLASVLGVWVGK